MNVNLSLLVALLQINIASGFFYIGLLNARYRNKLYGYIVEIFNAKFSEVDEETWLEEYDQKRDSDKQLSDLYFDVAKWIIELPSDYKSELNHNKIRERLEGAQNTDKLPWPYRWYKANGDRWATFIVCSVIPIIFLWCLALFGIRYQNTFVICSIIFLNIGGHACVSAHVWIGWRTVVDRYQNEFSATIEKLIRSAPASRVMQQVADSPTLEQPKTDNGDTIRPC